MRVFLDLNILLDVLLNRPRLVAESEAVILRCESLNAEMLIAWHSLATAYYLLRRGRAEEDALAEIDRILLWAKIAEASSFKYNSKLIPRNPLSLARLPVLLGIAPR